MSLATPSHNHSPQPPERPDRAFERRIWTNPEVCSECFSRLKHITSGRVASGVGYREFEHHDRVGDGVQGHDEINGAWKPRTFCRTCGGRGKHLSEDTILSTQEMVDRVPALVERLEEQDIRVDVDAVYDTVRVAKSMDHLQGRDREIFEGAVQLGIEHAYGLR